MGTEKERSPSKPLYVFCTGNRYGDLHLYYLRGNKVDAGSKSRTESKNEKRKFLPSPLKKSSSLNQVTPFKINPLVEDASVWDSPLEKNIKSEVEPSSMRLQKKVRH